MKKHFSILYSLLVILILTLSLTACDISTLFGKKEEHTHTYSDRWESNAESHWLRASCNDTDECATAKVALGAHAFENGKCTVCGYADPDYISGEHTHTYDNSCDTDCNICGAEREPGHVYSNVCDNSCDVCGAVRSVTHDAFDDADCTTETKCTLCNQVIAEAPYTEHSFTNSCDTSCNNEGCEYTRTIEHTPEADDFNCTTATNCSVCGVLLEAAPAEAHTYTNVCDTTCDNEGCNYTREAHLYDNNCDADCNVCENVRTPADHVYGDDLICDECGLGSAVKPLDISIPGTFTLSYIPGEAASAVWYKFTTAGKVTLGITLSENTVMSYGTDPAYMLSTNGSDTYYEFTLEAETAYYVSFITADKTEGEITAEVKCYTLVNIIETIEFPNAGYTLSSTDGELSESENYSTTDYIDISDCAALLRVNRNSSKYAVIGYAVYDENKTFIKMTSRVGTDYEFQSYDYYYDADAYTYCYYYDLASLGEDAKYVRLCTETKYINNQFSFKFVTNDTEKVEMPLYGKTIISFGDSIFGNNNTGTGVCNQIKLNTGADVYNCAFGGTRAYPRAENAASANEPYRHFDMMNLIDAIIAKDYTNQDAALTPAEGESVFNARFPAMLERIKNLTFTDQIVTLNHGTNDWNSGVDVEVYKDALKYVITQLKTNYPDLQIVLISPTWRCTFEDGAVVEGSGSRTNKNGLTVSDFADAMKKVAEEMNVDFIDCYNIGINEENCLDYFNGTDGTHHDEPGRIYLAKHISTELAKIVK